MTVREVVWPGGDLRADGADWLWILSPGAQPRANALEALLAAAGHLNEPVVLAPLVLDAVGAPRADRLPAGSEADTAAAIAAVAGRTLPIRNAPFAGTLVRASAFRRYGEPDPGVFGAHAPLVWTARALAEAAGYLVPAAVVVEAEPRPAAGLGVTLRTARSGVWTRGEQVRAVLSELARARRR